MHHRLRFLSTFAVLAAFACTPSAQPAPAKAPAGKADAGFGPWLDPSRDEPAGMRYRTFVSKLAGTEVSYLVYLPPGYDEATDRRYPVIYWLHGRGGSQTGAAAFASRLDAAIKAGQAPAMIVVGVNGRKTSSGVDSFDGTSPVQSVLIQELIPHIDATCRTVARREGRGIEGFSMGGAGAAKVGFKHPDLFGAVGVLGGALHDLASYAARGTAFQDIYGGNKEYFEANNPWTIVEKNAGAIRGRTFVRGAVGAKDNLLERNTSYHELLTKLGIEHTFDVVPEAAHNPAQVYDGLGAKTWEFYTRAFAQGAAPSGAPPPAATTVPPPKAAGARVSNEAPLAWVGVAPSPNWRTFTVKTADGVETPAIWAAPDGAGPFPAVVWFHGAPPAQGERGERNEAERARFDLFLKAGFVVCLGDYRGRSPEGSELSAADDAAAVIGQVKSLPAVDPQRVAAMGHSLGAATMLLAVGREPVACVVDSAAAGYSVLGMPAGSLRGRPPGGALPATEYNRQQALANLERINAPTLILYGEGDPLSRLNKTIHELMVELKKNVRLATFPGEHHGMLFRPNDRERGLQAWTTMLEFVSSTLRVPPTVRAATANPAAAERRDDAAGSASAVRRIPAGVKAHRDLAYVANGHERQKLDLYLPEQGDGPFPLIAWIHGGGWAAGEKSDCPPLNQGFVARGYAVASLGYRLSGHAIFPAQIEDCKAAIRWLRAHAKEYRLNPAHIGVWGSSAGGHLVALLGTSGEVKEFDVGAHLDQSSRVQAVCDYFGPTDFLQMDAHALKGSPLIHDAARSPESRLVGGPIQENAAQARRANPISYVTKDDPPFFIVHGDQDPLVPHHQSELLFAALVQAGVPVRFTTVVGGGHGAGFPGAELGPLVREFFDRHLKGDANAARWPAASTSEIKATAAPAAPGPARGGQPAGKAAEGAGGGIPPWAVLLQRDDADRDGRLSRAEFKGPAALFNRLDRNGDGFLTEEEHEGGLRAMGRR
jgi:acetyl esterase/lipase